MFVPRSTLSALISISAGFAAIIVAAGSSGIAADIPIDANQSVQQVVHAIEARYHSARTLKAVFLERYNEGRLTTRVESGTVFFSRPGRMRWEYVVPEEKLFLTDGKTAWFYVPTDHTVTRAPMKESDDWRTPLALLAGKANLGRFCKTIEFVDRQDASPGNVTLRCIPAGTSTKKKLPDSATTNPALSPSDSGEIQDVLLEADPGTGWLATITIRQSGGVQIEYRFGKWAENVDLPETLFHFSAPKGVAIVEEGAPGGTSH